MVLFGVGPQNCVDKEVLWSLSLILTMLWISAQSSCLGKCSPPWVINISFNCWCISTILSKAVKYISCDFIVWPDYIDSKDIELIWDNNTRYVRSPEFCQSHFPIIHNLLKLLPISAKGSRHQAVQVNIFTAYLAALKYTSEQKVPIGNQDVISQANQVWRVNIAT